MTTFFTADHHFGHKNMLTHEPLRKELFDNINKYDNSLIQRHNSVVTNDDIVYFVGDFVPFKKDRDIITKYVGKMNGKEKHLILGNHDEAKPFTYVDAGFTSVHTSLTIGNFVLNHDPCIKCVLRDDQILICGHVHTLFRILLADIKVINVGVDVWNFYPISLDYLLDQFPFLYAPVLSPL